MTEWNKERLLVALSDEISEARDARDAAEYEEDVCFFNGKLTALRYVNQLLTAGDKVK